MIAWVRFFCARVMARGDMSMPWILRVGICGVRREERRSGMQPVPVQRSRTRRVQLGGVGEEEERRREARWVVNDSVSGLWVHG